MTGVRSVDTQRWELAGNIFERLLGTPRDERKDLLETICGEDAELRDIVVSMLDSGSSAIAFDKALVAAELKETIAPEDAPPVNRHVGPWRLTHELGTGGMGVVWMAERADGQFEQRAALKLIKRGMDSDAVLKRFLRERQILARLDHPNIAHLLDGGIASDGRPYFAMEYVEGSPLLRYCHEHTANLETRIRLFLDVCNAVQFAHSHHVVHRDLKPSNVLVTRNGAVKLLDFGIAKLLATDDSGVETITHLQRDRPMTPAYAAPEQIRGGTISEATDIYALGCMLYEVLSGQRAYDFAGAADAKDVLRIIEATDPIAPSRLKIAHSPILLKRLRGDLDTIVLTALRHDPARRYPSVEAFATDLRNYLTGKPISARRDSVFYRSYKFMRRHRAGMAASIAVVAIAVAAFVFELRARGPLPAGSSIAIVDFNNLSQRKENDWIRAALEVELATELSAGGVLSILPAEIVRPAHADLAPPETDGYSRASLQTLRKRLGVDYVLSGNYLVSGQNDAANVRLDLFLQNTRTGQTTVRAAQSEPLVDLPTLVKNMGNDLRHQAGIVQVNADTLQEVYKAQPTTFDLSRHMGLALDALRNKYDPALAKRELLEATALDPRYAPAYVLLAEAWRDLGYPSKALANAQQAAAYAEGLPADQRLQIDRQVAVQKTEWSKAIDLDRKLIALNAGDVQAQFSLIDDLISANQLKEAETALADLRKKASASADDPRLDLRAANIAYARGDNTGQAHHAELALRAAQSRDEQSMIATAQLKLASARDALGKQDEAEKLTREAIEAYQRTNNPHGEADARVLLAIILGERDKPQEERDEYQKAMEIYKRTGNQAGIALIYMNLMRVLWNHGDRDAAETAANNAMDILKETGDVKRQIWVTTMRTQVEMDEAASDATISNLHQAIDLNERAGDRGQLVDALYRYAEGLRRRGELEEAGNVCARTLNEAKELGDPYSKMVAENECAQVTRDRGDIPAAIAAFEHARTTAVALNDPAFVATVDVNMAQILMDQQNWADAANRLKTAIVALTTGDSVASEANAQSLLALCYQKLHRPAERDQAAARAKDQRTRTTTRYEVIGTDVALAQLNGETQDRHQAIQALRAIADDAERRHWIIDSMEAKLAAFGLLEGNRERDDIAWIHQLETQAREHRFDWALQRMKIKSTP
jgi:serine/threonine protein kinase/tetratricopeptide (TPR) repeat protein